MKFEKNTVSDIKIAFIGGDSRGRAWDLMSNLALDTQLSGNVRIYDINNSAAQQNEIIGNKFSNQPEAKSNWNYKAYETIEEILKGSDLIIISILPGTLTEMSSDVHLPEAYGIYQAVGDTVGPGGHIRALRTIPIFTEFAENIKKFAPNAWVINYTDPLTLSTRALFEAFPEIKAFGYCSEVSDTKELLVSMLSDLKILDGIKSKDIKLNLLGLNHFTWVDSAFYNGIDLFPLYRQFVFKYYEEGFTNKNPKEDTSDFFKSKERVKFDLFKRYGLIAAAGDRHLAEFCPPWYIKNLDCVNEWSFKLTPVSYRIEEMIKRENIAKKYISGEEEVKLKASEDESIKIIKALLGLGDIITNVNIPNLGQIENLPQKVVVETNALISINSIRGVVAGKLPPEIHNLVSRQVSNQETILQAALSKDKVLAFRAFANDPLVTISISDTRKLFNRMLENTKEYLPGWKI